MTGCSADDHDGIQLSSVDIALLPWAFRYYVFEHYRGAAFAIPRQDPTLAAYFAWLDYALQLPQVCMSTSLKTFRCRRRTEVHSTAEDIGRRDVSEQVIPVV